jgi:hypothetical protein
MPHTGVILLEWNPGLNASAIEKTHHHAIGDP